MSTIDYQLNILRDTQMVQRRLLEKQFPYIDWARMPFSSYGDFFRLRGILDDCGAVWTNAYGRSNTEPDGQRNFLEDYSGNGRDIELFNFGWTDGSGYKDGALVGDGIDDYGQCIKDFALPDDYTVVAMREILNDAGCLISKSISNSGQAFILENIDTDGSMAAWSFGNFINVSTLPKLFSWLTKTSYNGNEFAPGTKKDSTDLPLTVFLEGGNSRYMSAALYSFGIFTRTLTEEELRIVENCMYAEWIAMTGKLEDIEYYDILDARFRSNEEDADKRNKWVGRLGKLHMTLNNYGYSGNSGWNGETGEDGKPLYGGALVSDGVDDNAVSDEVIDEEIGGVVLHCTPIAVVSGNNGYIWCCGGGLGLANHNIGGVLTGGNKIVLGNPWTEFNRNDDEIYGLSRVPGNPIGNLIIGHYTNESASSALYQLRLIKNQPTDVQLEAIKWQCRKEHDDYLIHMGWKEVE